MVRKRKWDLIGSDEFWFKLWLVYQLSNQINTILENLTLKERLPQSLRRLSFGKILYTTRDVYRERQNPKIDFWSMFYEIYWINFGHIVYSISDSKISQASCKLFFFTSLVSILWTWNTLSIILTKIWIPKVNDCLSLGNVHNILGHIKILYLSKRNGKVLPGICCLRRLEWTGNSEDVAINRSLYAKYILIRMAETGTWPKLVGRE